MIYKRDNAESNVNHPFFGFFRVKTYRKWEKLGAGCDSRVWFCRENVMKGFASRRRGWKDEKKPRTEVRVEDVDRTMQITFAKAPFPPPL